MVLVNTEMRPECLVFRSSSSSSMPSGQRLFRPTHASKCRQFTPFVAHSGQSTVRSHASMFSHSCGASRKCKSKIRKRVVWRFEDDDDDATVARKEPLLVNTGITDEATIGREEQNLSTLLDVRTSLMTLGPTPTATYHTLAGDVGSTAVVLHGA